MERVSVLVERLNEQLKNNASASTLLLTTQLLLEELTKESVHAPKNGEHGVAVFFPGKMHVVQTGTENEIIPQKETVLQKETVSQKEAVQQKETAPPKEIKQPVVEKPVTESENIPAAAVEQPVKESKHGFDSIYEIPTLALKQQEINEIIASQSESLNDKLKTNVSNKEVAHTIKDTPIKDLRKAVGINDRYLFINELFRGDETMYERSIKTINGFNIYGEAEFWIKRELKLKLGWNEESEAVKLFDQLIKRRFS